MNGYICPSAYCKRLLTGVLIAIGSAGSIEAQTDSGNELLQAAIRPFVDSAEISGAVVLVADQTDVIGKSWLGLADREANLPMKEYAIFWIASMSKPITGACMMMLVDEQKVQLQDPITKYLPEMQNLKLDDGTPVVITIRHLLSHTSGMAELGPGETYTAKNLAEASGRYAKVKMNFAPGSKWQYSQTSINTAARIIEVVSGQSFDQFVEQRLCKPLGMKDTTFYLSEDQYRRLAKSYQRTDEGKLEEAKIRLLSGKLPTDRDRMPAANGGLFSTAADYSRFCQMLLNKGQGNGQKLLSPEAVKVLQTVVPGDLVTGFTPGNGLGIGWLVVRGPRGVTEHL